MASSTQQVPGAEDNSLEVHVASKWISEADVVLICAGAGMSASDGENVYVSEEDFHKHYPWMKQYGYSTAYECMGLLGDPNIPIEVKWGQFASHYTNIRRKFKPNHGYNILKKLVGNREHFILTSNVDGCFERAGFDINSIYTPQGDATYIQCLNNCCKQAVFNNEKIFEKMLLSLDNKTGKIDKSLIPKCQFCQSPVFMNLRGGSWFQHSLYDKQNNNFIKWINHHIINSKKSVAIIEIGAGFNTPTVTRYPIESILRESLNKKSSLIRINPIHYHIPYDIKNGISLKSGWEILYLIESILSSNISSELLIQYEKDYMSENHIKHNMKGPKGHWQQLIEHLR